MAGVGGVGLRTNEARVGLCRGNAGLRISPLKGPQSSEHSSHQWHSMADLIQSLYAVDVWVQRGADY